MNKERVKRQQRKYMFYNFVAFTIIFSVFGLIIYSEISRSLYSRIDHDLERAREAILSMPDFVDVQLSLDPFARQPQIADEHRRGLENMGRAEDTGRPENAGKPNLFVPMRVTMIVRSADGEVENGLAIGRMFWDNYVNEIPFQTDKQGVTMFRLGDGSSVRSMTFAHTDASGGLHYIQLIANADGERGIIESFLSILLVCIAGFILVSISASYFLALNSMKPLIRAWERQSEFVENASHELRTPLTIIQNKLEALLREPQATMLEKADSIALSLSETRRLSNLTTDLMTLARADSNQTQIMCDSFEIDALIRSVYEPYAELAEMQGKKLLLDLKHGGQVVADKGRIHELMVILLDNALKYTEEGENIEIATALRDGKLEIAVKDEGQGMSETARVRAFDRFYREDKARSREGGGSGLGLSIAKWIVDVHGGSVKILQNKPKGSVLEVKIPK